MRQSEPGTYTAGRYREWYYPSGEKKYLKYSDKTIPAMLSGNCIPT